MVSIRWFLLILSANTQEFRWFHANQCDLYEKCAPTMAGKAIRDLHSGEERELRNVIELCKGRSAPPCYQQFWNMLESILRRPNQQYGVLLSRAANDVDLNCLKTLIANLGLHAYAGGSEALRDNWEAGAASPYWMEPLDGTMEPDILHQTISNLQQQGASSFLFRVEQETELKTVLNIAGKYRQCMFFLICRVLSCCQEYLEEMVILGNVIPLIECGNLLAISSPLKQAGILFGFHRDYSEIQSLKAEARLLQQLIEKGCFLGVYEGSEQYSSANPDLFYYAKLQEIRSRGTKEIFLADLWRDRETVQNFLLHRQGLPDDSLKRKSGNKIGGAAE